MIQNRNEREMSLIQWYAENGVNIKTNYYQKLCAVKQKTRSSWNSIVCRRDLSVSVSTCQTGRIILASAVCLLCVRGKEIILIASQAQTIPFYCNNLLEFPSLQYHFALGALPDAVVICINYHDELDYIRNTVYTIKGLTDASLIAFVMYPMTFLNEWSNAQRRITYEEYNAKAEDLRRIFNVPVYLLGEHIKDLCQDIIDYF